LIFRSILESHREKLLVLGGESYAFFREPASGSCAAVYYRTQFRLLWVVVVIVVILLIVVEVTQLNKINVSTYFFNFCGCERNRCDTPQGSGALTATRRLLSHRMNWIRSFHRNAVVMWNAWHVVWSVTWFYRKHCKIKTLEMKTHMNIFLLNILHLIWLLFMYALTHVFTSTYINTFYLSIKNVRSSHWYICVAWDEQPVCSKVSLFCTPLAVPQHTCGGARGGGRILHIHDIDTGWGEWSVSRPGRPVERISGTHWTRGWVGPRAGLNTETRGKIPCLDCPVVQSVVRHYTDWATPAPLFSIYISINIFKSSFRNRLPIEIPTKIVDNADTSNNRPQSVVGVISLAKIHVG
jgi:hypothetical protein